VSGPPAGALVLAVDCSTTAAKAVVVDGTGTPVASASTPLSLDRPGPGRHEQDAADWWQATRRSTREAVRALDDPGRVAAACLTHQRESFVCLDDQGDPLRPAILWLDSRAGAEIADLGSDRVLALSGKPPDTTPAIYKLAWLSRHEPEVLAGAARVAEVHGYLAAHLTGRLTGRWSTSTASADSLGLLDLRAGTWSDELLSLAGVRPDQLPELVPPGQLLGEITAEMATDLGLRRPIPLIAGLGDGQAAGLGAGVVEPGTAYLNLGTSMVLGTPSPDYLTGTAFRTLAGAPAGTFVLETVLNAAAYLADWFRGELGTTGDAAPDPALEAAAAGIPPGADGLLVVPYWNAAQTPYWDAAARGVILGLTGAHTRAHVYRALLEGVAFELRLHLEGLEAATRTPITSIRAMGGGSRSPVWAQIVADVTGRELRLCAGEEISARGAAVLAWAGAGLGGDVGEVSRAMAALAGTVTPEEARAAHYARLFTVQREIYPRLREVFGALAVVSGEVTSRSPR